MAFGISQSGFAQSDGTGADAPGSGECAIIRADTLPAVDTAPVATPIAPDAATPGASDAATPIASPEATSLTDLATPIASPDSDSATPISDIATPIASPVSEGATPTSDDAVLTPNQQVEADLNVTVASLISCLNDRSFDVYAAMTSDDWHGAIFGLGEPLTAEEFEDFAPVLPDVDTSLVEVNNLQVLDETTVSVDVQYTTASQLHGGTWTFTHGRVEGLPTWILQSETPLEVTAPAGAATLTLTMADDGYTLSPSSATGTDLVLAVSNPTDNLHEALVLKLGEGAETSTLLQTTSGSLPDGFTFVGQASVSPGGSGNLVLVGLEPGTYTIVDLLPDENGLPHLGSGMEITFTIGS